MAGISVDGSGHGGRKSVDSEINMIPMIDLLMVTVSFLLLTAVWTQMGRVEASAQVPGAPDPTRVDPPKEERKLHLDVGTDAAFHLTWKQAGAVVDTFEVPRVPVRSGVGSHPVVRYPDLSTKLGELFRASGAHQAPTDEETDVLVLHADDSTRYEELVQVMDAVAAVQKKDAHGHERAAYRITFAVK